MTSSLVLGRFQVSRQLAAGGMGAVFLGFDRDDQMRPVVVKTMLPELARRPEMAAQFRDEVAITRLVSHPNVVEVVAFGEDEGGLCLVMEYIPGLSLAELMKRSLAKRRRIPHAIAVRVVCDVLSGLQAVHDARTRDGLAANIVHRDISPQNIMLDVSGTAKLLDFGIARAAVREAQTATGMLKGKLAYMSPEQVSSRPVDARSDQFSLGIVLWELCAGQRLFSAGAGPDVVRKIMEDPILDLNDVVEGVDPTLSSTVATMLARDPDRRFASCGEAAAALSGVLETLPQGQSLGRLLAELGWTEPDPTAPMPSAARATGPVAPSSTTPPTPPVFEARPIEVSAPPRRRIAPAFMVSLLCNALLLPTAGLALSAGLRGAAPSTVERVAPPEALPPRTLRAEQRVRRRPGARRGHATSSRSASPDATGATEGARRALAMANMLLLSEGPDQALRKAHEAKRLDPAHNDVNRVLGLIYRRMGEHRKAARAYKAYLDGGGEVQAEMIQQYLDEQD